MNFQAVVLKPHKKSQKKLTETLNQMYGHLDSKYLANEAAEVSILSSTKNEEWKFQFFEKLKLQPRSLSH